MLGTNHTTSAALFLALSTVIPACGGFGSEGDFDLDADRLGDADDAGQGDDEGGEGDGGSQDDGRDCIQPNGDGDGDGDGGCGLIPAHLIEDGGVCAPHETDLIAGQHFDTGTVTLSNDNNSLLLEVDAAAPYLLAEVHAYVGTDPVPTNNGGAMAPGQFPYTHEFIDPAQSWQLELDLDALEVGCGDELNVAVHATVVSFENGMEVFAETAWAFGPNEFRTSWGWSYNYAICCEPEPSREDDHGCTLTQGFWRTHNAEAEIPALQQPWPISEDTQLCGQSWLDILHTEPEGDAWLILAHQAIAAQLNVASEASAPSEVEDAIAQAVAQLDTCSVSDEDRDAALAISDLLDAYNNGIVGPGHCE